MNNVDKTILLAENFGANISNYGSSYIEGVLKSAQFENLVSNVQWASNFELSKSVALLDDFKSVNYNITTFEQAIVLSARINYLYSVSEECYYLNPLIKYPFVLRTKSIGELTVNYDGKVQNFNQIIMDNSHPLAYKAKVISEQCEFYRRELNAKNQADLERTKDNKGAKSITFHAYSSIIYRCLMALAATICVLGIFIWDKNICLRYINEHSFTDIYTYSFSLFIIGTAITDIFVVAMYCYISSYFYPYFYFHSSGKKRVGKLLEKINKEAQNLAEYILQACKDQKPLTNDISKFQVASVLPKEFGTYLRIYNFKKKSTYVTLRNFYIFGVALLLVGLAIGVVSYLMGVR